MQLLGRPISPGYAAGTAVVLQPSAEVIPRRAISASLVKAEFERFDRAVAESARELDETRHRVLRELGKSHSGIFSAHLAILQDSHFVNRVRARIESDLVNVEQALDAELAEICDQFARSGAPYFRERQQDIRDVGRRLLGHLSGAPVVTSTNLPPRSVLVARELLPSDTLNIDRAHLAAILTEQGGETSHTAILARALGVPAVTALDGLLRRVRPGMELLVNGDSGEVIASPSAPQTLDFAREVTNWVNERTRSLGDEFLPSSTLDGIDISLQANIARPEEAEAVIQHRLDGVGLLRSEFLFLDATAPPALEYQVEVYRQIADSVQGKPITIRTLDMAWDKHPRFLSAQFDHALLSFRGLRFSLKEKNLFCDQVQAIVRGAKGHDLRILLPMVVDTQDVARAIEIVRECASREGMSRAPAIGVMIETPAAVVLFDGLVELADFVSIGTNDLTQYMLATDRGAFEMDDDYSAIHPAVLRTIPNMVEQCANAKKPMSVCGEAAGDPKAACLFAGLGVRQLSMSPARAARVRQALRTTTMAQLKQLGELALRCKSTAEVRELLNHELIDARF